MKKKSCFILITFFLFEFPLLAKQKRGNTEWLPVISLCTKDKKVKKKIDYKAKYKIFDKYTESDKEKILCTEENTKNWDDLFMKPRGNSSYHFAKKQYRLKFEDKKGEDREISLGGMPKASKWVLHAPYVDKSLIRNLCAYDLGGNLGRSRGDKYFAPKGKPYEVFLNGKYQGLYLLLEKIERSKHKVDFPKLSKQDKHTLPFLAEISAKDGEFKTKKRTAINYRYPSFKKINKIKKENPKDAEFIKEAIQSEIDSFERLLSDNKRLTRLLLDKKQNIIDIDSFVDYILLQEIFKNVDGYRRSVYFQKLEDGRIRMGPLWDYNLAMGNLSFYKMSSAQGWLYKVKHSLFKNSFWFKSLIKNRVFQKKMRERYLEQRKSGGLFSNQAIIQLINSHVKSLKGAPLRDFQRWKKTQGLVEYLVFTTEEKGESPNEHIAILKKWLLKRLQWLECNIYGIYD